MSNWFAAFAQTPTGIALAEIIDEPERIFEFRSLSENGKPAVQAVARDVSAIISGLATKREQNAASQFVGWYVGQIMRDAGYEVVQERGRVSDGPYKTGAVWRQIEREPKLVSEAPPTAGLGRLKLQVTLDGSRVVADWEVTTTEISPVTHKPRRVHSIKSPMKPVEEAVAEALAYAKRYGFAEIWVFDPDLLFPREKWPRGTAKS